MGTGAGYPEIRFFLKKNKEKNWCEHQRRGERVRKRKAGKKVIITQKLARKGGDIPSKHLEKGG